MWSEYTFCPNTCCSLFPGKPSRAAVRNGQGQCRGWLFRLHATDAVPRCLLQDRAPHASGSDEGLVATTMRGARQCARLCKESHSAYLPGRRLAFYIGDVSRSDTTGRHPVAHERLSIRCKQVCGEHLESFL